MAFKYIERVPAGAAYLLSPITVDSAGNVAGIVVDSDDDNLKFYDRTAGLVRVVSTGVLDSITPTAAFALTALQSGIDVFLNAAAGFAITLPLPAAGLRYRFTTAAAFATTNFTVVTNGGANLFQGGADVNSTEVLAAAQDSINFVATAETIGDYIELWSDGTSWFITGRGAQAGSITFTVT